MNHMDNVYDLCINEKGRVCVKPSGLIEWNFERFLRDSIVVKMLKAREKSGRSVILRYVSDSSATEKFEKWIKRQKQYTIWDFPGKAL